MRELGEVELLPMSVQRLQTECFCNFFDASLHYIMAIVANEACCFSLHFFKTIDVLRCVFYQLWPDHGDVGVWLSDRPI